MGVPCSTELIDVDVLRTEAETLSQLH